MQTREHLESNSQGMKLCCAGVDINTMSYNQISVKAFTLETLDRKLVSFQQEVQESGLWLRCVPAPDRCPRWYWRINDGKLDLRGAL